MIKNEQTCRPEQNPVIGLALPPAGATCFDRWCSIFKAVLSDTNQRGLAIAAKSPSWPEIPKNL